MGNRLIFLVLLLFVMSGCQDQILHDLEEGEANRVVSELHDAGIESRKERQADGRWAISVSERSRLQSLQRLRVARLLPEAVPGESTESPLMASREEQRFQFERAVSRELERTLSALEGVLHARVHLNLVAVDPLFGRPVRGAPPSGGSVLLVVKSGCRIDRAEVRTLVARAAGLDEERVAVLIDTTHELAAAASSQSTELKEAAALSEQRPVKLAAAALLLVIGGSLLFRLRAPAREWR